MHLHGHAFDIVRVAVCALDVLHGYVSDAAPVIICCKRTEDGSNLYVCYASLAKSYARPMLHVRLAEGDVQATFNPCNY